MNDPVRRTLLGLLAFAACAPAQARSQMREDMDLAEISLSGRTPESIILLWPTFSFRLARLMIAKYGQPFEATDHGLVWLDNDPWNRTVVYRDPPGRGVNRKQCRLEQSVAYPVPADKLAALSRFDKDLEADAKDGRLTACSDDESENFLAMNLADEIIRDRRTAKEAAEFRRNASRLRDAGKSSPYFDGLLFVPRGPSEKEEGPD